MQFDYWNEVKTSTPAGQIDGVPDTATIWYCIVNQKHRNQTITVYFHREKYRTQKQDMRKGTLVVNGETDTYKQEVVGLDEIDELIKGLIEDYEQSNKNNLPTFIEAGLLDTYAKK